MEGKGFGIGRIFNRLRKMRVCECLSDLAILRLILYELQGLERLPSRSKILHHFRTKIPKEDWRGVLKTEILSDLCNPMNISNFKALSLCKRSVKLKNR